MRDRIKYGIYGVLLTVLFFGFVAVFIKHDINKVQKMEDRFLEIETRMNRLVYPYQGWTYGVETGCRGDTVVIYKYVDSVRIYSGGRDTVMVWRKLKPNR